MLHVNRNQPTQTYSFLWPSPFLKEVSLNKVKSKNAIGVQNSFTLIALENSLPCQSLLLRHELYVFLIHSVRTAPTSSTAEIKVPRSFRRYQQS